MSIANPFPRDLRRRTATVALGQSVFGPFDFKIFDVQDLKLEYRPPGQPSYVPDAGFSVVLDGPPPAYFTITRAGFPLGTLLKVRGLRLHERETDLLRAGVVSSAAIEEEADKVTLVLQEMRRDVDHLEATSLTVLDGPLLPLGDAAARINRALHFDASGQPILVDPVPGATLIPVENLTNMTAAGRALATAANATAQRQLLGLPEIPVYANLAAAAASSLLSVPAFLSIAGFATAGDGGGMLMKPCSPNANPGHVASVMITLQGGATHWFEIAEKTIYPEHFGAYPGLSTDRTALLAAIEFCRSRGVALHGRGQKFRFNVATEFTTPGTYLWKNIIFDMSTLPSPGAPPASVRAMWFKGSVFQNIGLFSANRAAGTDTFPLSSTAGLTVGDEVLVLSDLDWEATGDAQQSSYHTLSYVDAGQIRVLQALEMDVYTANAARILRMQLDIIIDWDDVEFLGPKGSFLSQAVEFTRCYIRHLKTKGSDFWDAFIVALGGKIGKVPSIIGHDVWFDNPYSRGYVFGLAGCFGGVIDYAEGRLCRHVITKGSSGGNDLNADPTWADDRLISRDIHCGVVRSYRGLASAYDQHAGCNNCSVDAVFEDRSYYLPTEEMLTIQGANARVGSLVITGAFSGPAVLVQSTGCGDKRRNVIEIGSIRAESDHPDSFLLAIDTGSGVVDQPVSVVVDKILGRAAGIVDVNLARSPVKLTIGTLEAVRGNRDGFRTAGAKTFHGTIQRFDMVAPINNAAIYQVFLGAASHQLFLIDGTSANQASNPHFRTPASSYVYLGYPFIFLGSAVTRYDATTGIWRHSVATVP